MADEFILTPRPVRVLGAFRQPLDQSLDVADYDEIDAVCNIDGVEGSTSGLAIRLLTSMQKDTEDGWHVLLTFTAATLNAPNKFEVQNADKKLLKYLRLEVTGIGGANAITFDISGMLRRRGM